MHIPKNILLISLFFWLSSVSFYSPSSTTIYKLQVAAFSEHFDRGLFDNLKDLGVLVYDYSDKKTTKVQLGTYMDRSTALRVQEIVKSRGYKECFLVLHNYLLEGTNGDALVHTLQFSATKKLDVSNLISRLSTDGIGQAIINDLCITYKGGLYRLSMGFIAAINTPKVDNYKTTMNQIGYSKTILQNFRSTSDNSPEVVIALMEPVKKTIKNKIKPSIDAVTFYIQKCGSCHGKDGKLGLAGAVDLSMSVLSTQQKIDVITKGQGMMPSFVDQLSEVEIKAIVKEVNKF